MIPKLIPVLLLGLVPLSPSILAAEPLRLGEVPQDLEMKDTQGKVHRFKDYRGKIVVLEWLNYGCPFVKKHYSVQNMQKLQKEETQKGVIWLSVVSSAPGKQGYYEPEEMNAQNRQHGNQATATILDPSGVLGKHFEAKTTPHMFILNQKGALVYRGAIDDRPTTDSEDIPQSKNYVSQALADLRAGRPVTQASTTAYGCGVKYAK